MIGNDCQHVSIAALAASVVVMDVHAAFATAPGQCTSFYSLHAIGYHGRNTTIGIPTHQSADASVGATLASTQSLPVVTPYMW
eukprot:COSAG01_NODE_1034_length_11999_cov_9.372857_2_plen_83_part_00